MKSELKPAPHLITGDATAIEVWYAGALVAVVYPADGPGVRIVSKHSLIATPRPLGLTVEVHV